MWIKNYTLNPMWIHTNWESQKLCPALPYLLRPPEYTSFKQSCNKLYSGDSFLFLNESFERMNQNQWLSHKDSDLSPPTGETMWPTERVAVKSPTLIHRVLLKTQINASSFPRSSILQKLIKVSHLEGQFNFLKPLSHCMLVTENCQKIAGVPSVWTQTRPGINSGIDPGLGT